MCLSSRQRLLAAERSSAVRRSRLCVWYADTAHRVLRRRAVHRPPILRLKRDRPRHVPNRMPPRMARRTISHPGWAPSHLRRPATSIQRAPRAPPHSVTRASRRTSASNDPAVLTGAIRCPLALLRRNAPLPAMERTQEAACTASYPISAFAACRGVRVSPATSRRTLNTSGPILLRHPLRFAADRSAEGYVMFSTRSIVSHAAMANPP
jgi:hypothetical protein